MIFTFFIRDLYTTTAIDEPKGWKDLMSELDRQFDTHGVFFSYAGGGDKAGTVFKLGFACEGKTLLEAEYQDKGTEGFYQFGVDEAANEFVTPTNIFLGDIDFGTRGFDEEFFEAEINQITNIVKLKNRGGLKTSFNKQLTHDGITVSKLNNQDIVLLATKDFAKLVIENTGEVSSDTSIEGNIVSRIALEIGYKSIESIELESYVGENISTYLPEFLDVSAFLTLAKKSAITMQIDFDFDYNITQAQGSGNVAYTIEAEIRADTIPEDGHVPHYTIFSDSANGASVFNHSGTATGSVNKVGAQDMAGVFKEGTNFVAYIFVTMQSDSVTTQFDITITIRSFKITFTNLEADLGTIAKCYHPFDALNKTLNFITGEYDFLVSDLLGDINRGYDIDGCFSTMRMTNGYGIRQILDDDKVPIESFKGFIDNLDAPGAIGYGIEELESPEVLGEFTVQWKVQGPPTHTVWVTGNITADISIGTKISFYNSDLLFGTYAVTAISFTSVTVISFTSTGTDLNITIDLSMQDVVITSNKTTTFRDRLRVEKWEHFYKDTQLIELEAVQDYSEEPFSEALYNEFNLGFRKFANDEDKPTTLEDFATKSSWEIPLVQTRKTLTKIMTWIMSSFMINESRGTLFDEKPTTSHKLDDDIFLFDVVDASIDTTVTFVHNVSSDETITVSANVYENYIRDAAIFSIENATIPDNNQAYLFEPSKTVHLLPSDTYKLFISLQVVVSDVADPCTVNGFIFIGAPAIFAFATKAESTEKVNSVSGLSGPDYTYNLRRTQKRFLIRWGRFINSVLGYISDTTQTIQNLFYTSNGALTTELDTSQLSNDCLMGDLSGSSIQENTEINTAQFPLAKFKPNIINCTIKICDTDYDMILAAHKNRLQSPDDGKNYGFFVVTSPLGVQKSGWLMNMKRSPINRIAKLRLLEKFNAFGAGSGIYNFFKPESITIANVPGIERTSTFYFKCNVQNFDGNAGLFLWNMTGSQGGIKGMRITLWGSDVGGLNSKFTVEMLGDLDVNNAVAVISNGTIGTDDLHEIEIWYDGSSTAAGITAKIDGVATTFQTSASPVTISTDNGNGSIIDVFKPAAISTDKFRLDSLELTKDDILQYKTNCNNDGLTATDLSGNGYDGVIDLSSTDPIDFFTYE